jgi:hypothetical protein
MSKFIPRIQASLQGCIIETPHSDDIRAIVGTAQCPYVGLRPGAGWTDGEDCDGSGTYVVKFNKVIYWGLTNGIEGVKILNATTPETGTVVSVAEASGTSDTLSYTVTWVTPPAVGETVVFDYEAAPPDGTGAGVYEDEDGERMQSVTTVPMTNCLDIPATNFAATATGQTTIDLTWTDPVVTTGYDNYILKRNGIQIATPAIGAELYNDSGLDPNTTYNYTLQTRANGSDIGGALSDSATTFPVSGVDAWGLSGQPGDRWLLSGSLTDVWKLS